MSSALDSLKALQAERQIERDRELLPLSLVSYVKEAWKVWKPDLRYLHNWHIDVICAHLEAVSEGTITRLQIWVPPGSMKTGIASIMWPTWEWTRQPWLKYWTASYETSYAWRINAEARDLILDNWYQERWPHVRIKRDSERYVSNFSAGTRLATAPESTGTGEHGHRILIDDPIRAQEAQRLSRSTLDDVNEWWTGTVVSRGLDGTHPEVPIHARVIIMQRLHEIDLAAHVLENDEWIVLCLPERFEEDHPFIWRGENVHPAVKKKLRGTPLYNGDPRQEGELLWPERRSEKASIALSAELGPFVAAAQLQQRPTAREGGLLRRDWWRFYDPRQRGLPEKMPRFESVVISVDTPLKDKESNDNVAIQCWGVKGADRYLLDLDLGKMNYQKAKRRVSEMARWARKLWPRIGHRILIENTGYGVELIIDLKREFTGVEKIKLEGDKIMRAEAASDALESGNVFLPGFGPPWQPAYDETHTPAEIAAFIHNCALFPNAAHDDDVDAWSQAMNWLRTRRVAPLRVSSVVGRIR